LHFKFYRLTPNAPAVRERGEILADNLILNFMDGRKIDAVSVGSFDPENDKINVVLSGKEKKGETVLLQDLCCVLIKGNPDISKISERQAVEEVETVCGDRFRVYTTLKGETENGFFGIPTQKTGVCKSIFFTHDGIRGRRHDQSLGEILKEKGYISDSNIEVVLEEQENLRHRRVGEIIAENNDLPQDLIDTAIRNAMNSSERRRTLRVGDLLVSAGLVTTDQVQEALVSQENGRKKKIGSLLIEKGFITEDQLLLALSAKFRMRHVDLKDIIPTQSALNALSAELVYRFKIMPLESDDKLIVVATSEPTDHTIAEILRFNTNRRVEMVTATSHQIAAAIDKYYPRVEKSMKHLLGDLNGEEIALEEVIEDAGIKETDSQVIKFVNGILLDAFHKNVSDIHMEPKGGKGPLQVRYRIDGECHIEHQIPSTFKKAIISRIKIMANLDIAERRRPQSGKIVLLAEKKKIEYRVETTPTVGDQEDAVLRILSSSKPLALDEMGFTENNLIKFKEIVIKPYGIILCVGPTGSGKTTSLHSALSYLNKPDRKIWTAEDPVEITQDGLRQVQVNPKIGFTFGEALRSFLRADPDVIMIGEMRDPETAKIAIEASLTGHLVFSTLHTNSAPETVVRLIEMGMDPYNFSDALLAIVAQRLARRFCYRCMEAYHPDLYEYQNLVNAYGGEQYEQDCLAKHSPEFSLNRRAGCPACDNNGYRGRIAIHELLIGTEVIKVAIKEGKSLEEIRHIAIHDGMRTLRMDGIQKVLAGLTDMDQVSRVCI
jgi:type II secretory ATPase GspE/PulE/Tfp pilus assembly ATPase PilB-like protein